MRRGMIVARVVAASVAALSFAIAGPAAAETRPSPPFGASVIVVLPSWDYENVAIAYDVLPAGDAPYGVGEVTGGPSCMVPAVPYYLYDDTAGGDTVVASGPGTGRYPDDPAANYELWEARGGAPGEYAVVVRWQGYCFRPGQPQPSGDELFPQEVAHPQGQAVEVTASVAVYEAGQTTPSSTTVLSGVVVAGADRPAKEEAVELGRVTLPPTAVAAPGSATEPDRPAAAEDASDAGPAGVAAEPSTVGPMDDVEEPAPAGGQDPDVALFLIILLLLVMGVSIAAVLTALLLRGRRERAKWAFSEPESVTPHEWGKRPKPTHRVTGSEAWPSPDPGPDDLPYPRSFEGDVTVVETRDGWAKVEDSSATSHGSRPTGSGRSRHRHRRHRHRSPSSFPTPA